jgi:Aldos-2-ulose dehydratase, beta-propeller domain/FG-GAP-like repeat
MTKRCVVGVCVCMVGWCASAFAADPPAPNFKEQVLDKISIGYGLAIGDVDGDKRPDILLADAKQFVWYHNPAPGSGEWAKHVMVENLTPRDNVCLAARDINGDGKVEVAVGAMWNPGETSDESKSGSVHYLLRPADPTQKWTPVELPHEPTTHRMHWVKVGDAYELVVLPLHGRGNKNNQGAGSKALAYMMPDDPSNAAAWKTSIVEDAMHATHNFDVVSKPGMKNEWLLIAGAEGVRTAMVGRDGQWHSELQDVEGKHYGAGEVRAGASVMKDNDYRGLYATIEPMHGNAAVAYTVTKKKGDEKWHVTRHVLTDALVQGHALAVADVLGIGRDQVVVGWRNPDKDKKVGIVLFTPLDDSGTNWRRDWIDDNGMATEDLKVADLDGDGDLDIIAAGRATKNVKIYWNQRN